MVGAEAICNTGLPVCKAVTVYLPSGTCRRRSVPLHLQQGNAFGGCRLRPGCSPRQLVCKPASSCAVPKAGLSDEVRATEQEEQQTSGVGANVQAEARHQTEQLWRLLFSNPSQWWDDRNKKRYPSDPDFVKKGTKERLWIDGNVPAWVQAELDKLPAPARPPPNVRQAYSPPSNTEPYRPGGRMGPSRYRPPVSEAVQADRERRAREILEGIGWE